MESFYCTNIEYRKLHQGTDEIVDVLGDPKRPRMAYRLRRMISFSHHTGEGTDTEWVVLDRARAPGEDNNFVKNLRIIPSEHGNVKVYKDEKAIGAYLIASVDLSFKNPLDDRYCESKREMADLIMAHYYPNCFIDPGAWYSVDFTEHLPDLRTIFCSVNMPRSRINDKVIPNTTILLRS
jgi:hypothetical protein